LHATLPSVTPSPNTGKIYCSIARIVAKSRTAFYFLAMIAATKKLRDMFISGYVTLGNSSCNLYRNKIARQVAKKFA